MLHIKPLSLLESNPITPLECAVGADVVDPLIGFLSFQAISSYYEECVLIIVLYNAPPLNNELILIIIIILPC